MIFFYLFKKLSVLGQTNTTHTTSMKSWASIVKTPAPAPAVAVASSTTAPAQQQQQQGDIFILLPPKIQTKKNASGGVPEKQ